jgi:predicted transposase YbfD/YdcC
MKKPFTVKIGGLTQPIVARKVSKMNYNTLPFEIELPEQALLIDLNELFEQLSELEDKRSKRGRRYALANLLMIAVLAKLAGQNQIRAISHWAKLRQTELSQLFGFSKSLLPHHTTWNRVLGKAVNPHSLSRLVGHFLGKATETSTQIPPRGSVLLAIDGKTLRGTIPLGQKRGVHLVAAYLPESGVVLAQIAVESKENEIVAAPKVLAELDLRGKVVVGDAMFCQRELSAQIVKGGGDYLWVVKENQKGVLEDLEILFEKEMLPTGCFSAEPTDFEGYEEWDKGHGRVEKRRITSSSLLRDYTPWPHLAQVFKLESWRWDSLGVGSYQVRYGLSSLEGEIADAKRLMALVREEWGIENGLHWRRDVTFQEDHSQLRQGQAPEVNAILNNLAVGLLVQKGFKNVAEARRGFDYLFSKGLFAGEL